MPLGARERRLLVGSVWGLAAALSLFAAVLAMATRAIPEMPRPARGSQTPVQPPPSVPIASLVEERPPAPARRPPRPPVRPPTPTPAPSPEAAAPSVPEGSVDPAGFPAVLASYDGIGREPFLRTMRSIGARLFLGDMDARRLIAEVDPLSDSLWTGFRPVDGLAIDRPRVLRGDQGAAAVLRQAAVSFGPGHYALVLLVPQGVEGRIAEAIQRELRQKGRSPEEFVSVRGLYHLSGEGLLLHLEAATDRKGTDLPLNVEVRLGG